MTFEFLTFITDYDESARTVAVTFSWKSLNTDVFEIISYKYFYVNDLKFAIDGVKLFHEGTET